MARLRENFQSGLITNNPLAAGGTSITSPEFANLPEVAGGNTLVLILDPEGAGNGPEIVTVTAHTTSATTVTVTRASEGTSAVEHAASTPWIHGPTAADWDVESAHNHDTDYAALSHVGSQGLGQHPAANGTYAGFMSASDKNKLDAIEAGATADQSAADIRGLGFFDTSNDGAGSGLDADKLDGQHGAYFSPASHTHDYAASGHNHDSRYFTESEVTSGFAAASHTHPTSDVVSLLAYIKQNLPGIAVMDPAVYTGAPGALTASYQNLLTQTPAPESGFTEAVTLKVRGFVVLTDLDEGEGVAVRFRVALTDGPEGQVQRGSVSGSGSTSADATASSSTSHAHGDGSYEASGIPVTGTSEFATASHSHSHSHPVSVTVSQTDDAVVIPIPEMITDLSSWTGGTNVSVRIKGLGGYTGTPTLVMVVEAVRRWS